MQFTKIISGLQVFVLLVSNASAQEPKEVDSLRTMQEVIITAFGQNRVVNSGTIVNVIQAEKVDRIGNNTSLVAAFNSQAGIRMEERSPGSYRVNIRGSSLRSPFGVRNVKVYWNNIPMTDAGGNTYFNQFSINDFSTLEIIKGPAGSVYGAGTGGVLLMQTRNNQDAPLLQLDYATGSFGMQNLTAIANLGNEKFNHVISYNRFNTDGYRVHTNQKKDKLNWTTRMKLSDRQELTGSLLYNNMFYETPGALNLTEFLKDPRSARPAAGSFPSATTARAAIYQKNLTIGLTNQYRILPSLTNTTTVYSSFNQVTNPAIRNYERRNEPGFGGRITFDYSRKKGNVSVEVLSGAELQYGFFNTQVFRNKNGNPDTLQTNDDIHYATGSFFTQGNIGFNNWIVTAGISLNRSKVSFTRLNQYPVLEQARTYRNELSPRIALQKEFTNKMEVFASVSRGFSPPTVSELLPSTGVINTSLEAEYGTNYEAGWRVDLLDRKLKIDMTLFYFKLNNALVSRRDSSNADFFINAGNTRQRGIEVNADYTTVFKSRVFQRLVVKPAFTFNKFTYGNLVKDATDFSGKKLPGVAETVIFCISDLQLQNNFYLSISYLFTGKIYLNDGNTATAEPFHLMGCRAGKKLYLGSKVEFDVYAGADNLLDATYSLGNDINAAAGHYYNAAPGRNYLVGFTCRIMSKKQL